MQTALVRYVLQCNDGADAIGSSSGVCLYLENQPGSLQYPVSGALYEPGQCQGFL